MEGSSQYLDDETLHMLGSAGVYFVYGLNRTHLNDTLVENLNRCRTFGIEVHVSITPTAEDLDFVNVWSYESLEKDIEEVLTFLDAAHFLGDPVTTLVYDMEPPIEKHFPLFGLDRDMIRGLKRHDVVRKRFTEFNRRVRENYHLDTRICSDVSQAIDPGDGDNDLAWVLGLLPDPQASSSYMAYRRGDFDRDFILTHCTLLKDGDTVILNAWKEKDHACWGDIQCAIADARLVLAYREKDLRLEIWALWFFLKSYGKEGIEALVEALSSDPSEWPESEVGVTGLRSVLSDLLFVGIKVLDFFGPPVKAVLSVI